MSKDKKPEILKKPEIVKAIKPDNVVKKDNVGEPNKEQIALQQSFQLLINASANSNGNKSYHESINNAVFIVAKALGFTINNG